VATHPDHIKLPATFGPRAGSDGPDNRPPIRRANPLALAPPWGHAGGGCGSAATGGAKSSSP